MAINLEQRPKAQPKNKEQNCVYISTYISALDPLDNSGNNGNTFSRYLPTKEANNHIRTALLNTSSTQDT